MEYGIIFPVGISVLKKGLGDLLSDRAENHIALSELTKSVISKHSTFPFSIKRDQIVKEFRFWGKLYWLGFTIALVLFWASSKDVKNKIV